MRAVALGSAQSAICAMASLVATSTNCPTPLCSRWYNAQRSPNALVTDAASSTRCPGGKIGVRSGTPALNAIPPVADSVALVATQSAYGPSSP